MLTRLRAQGYKSLKDIDIALPRLTVLFGPNSVGKSNLLDALSLLASTARERTLADALTRSVRGYPFEQLTLPHGGLPELLAQERQTFILGVEIQRATERYNYDVSIDVEPSSGAVAVSNEYLALLTKDGSPRGAPAISREGELLRIRRKGKPAHPREESIGKNHTELSDKRWGGDQYAQIERVRSELSNVRSYYLDPRTAMREGVPPQEVTDIGPLGEYLAPFLYRMKSQQPKSFCSVVRAVRSLIPTIEQIDVDLDTKRGLLDIIVTQDGIEYSSRVLSEGTLRVLALCAIAANPWMSGVVAFEEPENGVHPRRLELIAEILHSIAKRQNHQVIVTTHSALFCEYVLQLKDQEPDLVDLIAVGRQKGGTVAKRLEISGRSLLDVLEIESGLGSKEDGWFEELVLKGLVDA